METASEGGAQRAPPAARQVVHQVARARNVLAVLQRGVLVNGGKSQDCRPHSNWPSHAPTELKLTSLWAYVCALHSSTCGAHGVQRSLHACAHAHTGDHEKQQCGKCRPQSEQPLRSQTDQKLIKRSGACLAGIWVMYADTCGAHEAGGYCMFPCMHRTREVQCEEYQSHSNWPWHASHLQCSHSHSPIPAGPRAYARSERRY